MSNTFGTHFRLTTFGESHGAAIGGVVDGCPAGITYDAAFMESEMQRRHIGDGATTRQEPDRVEILSGIFEGRTLGTPIAFVIRNEDCQSKDYDELRNLFRPGHADYTYWRRYGLCDHRGGGRASGRETATRVAGGVFAKLFLKRHGISISSTCQHSAGGIVECHVDGLPAGVGDPCFDKLNARLAYAMMGIPSAIGFEMGAGFGSVSMSGLEYRDEWGENFSTKTNHCGGVQGGISNGMPVVFKVAFHAPVTVPGPTSCIDQNGNVNTITISGRHDRCHVPRTAVVVEAMTALVIADYLFSDHELS